MSALARFLAAGRALPNPGAAGPLGRAHARLLAELYSSMDAGVTFARSALDAAGDVAEAAAALLGEPGSAAPARAAARASWRHERKRIASGAARGPLLGAALNLERAFGAAEALLVSGDGPAAARAYWPSAASAMASLGLGEEALAVGAALGLA